MRKIAFGLLWLYVFTVPWDMAVEIPGFGSLTRGIGIVTVFAVVVLVMAEGRFRKPDAILGVAIAFTLVSALSMLWTISYPATAQSVRRFVQLLGSVWAIRELAQTQQHRQKLLVAFCLGLFVPMVNLLIHFQGGLDSAGRYTADGLNANTLGSLLVIGTPIAWHLMRTTVGPARVIALTYLALAPPEVLLTGTRGSFVAGLVTLSILPLSRQRKSLRPIIRVTLLLILTVALIGLMVPASIWARMATIPSEIFGGGSLDDRRALWAVGLNAFPAHPMLGVGAGAYSALLQNAGYHSMPAHNLFVGLLVELGVTGLLVFVALLAVCSLRIARMVPPERKVWGTLMISFVVAVMSQSLETWKVTWFLFGVLAAQGKGVALAVQTKGVSGTTSDGASSQRQQTRAPSLSF
jgi:O-antigen ligase